MHFGPGTEQMVRDVVAGTGVTVRELVGWLSFGLLPAVAYLYVRRHRRIWVALWALSAAGWWLAGRPPRTVWDSTALGAVWIALALLTHALPAALRLAIRRGPARSRSGPLRLLLIGWTAALLLHPSVVLYRVTRDWYDCPCQRQPLK